MPTEIYSGKHLELFIEADNVSGANGASVSSISDNSGKGRDFTASSNFPTLKTDAAPTPESGVFHKSVVFNNSNPLVWSGEPFKLAAGFLVLKINSLDNFDGFLTDATTNPILVGNPGNQQFWNQKNPYFEMRINDQLFRLNSHINEQPPVVIGDLAIYYFNYWQGITVSSLQIGQDRADTTRRADMEFFALALYSNYSIGEGGEKALRKNTESFAYSYQIPIYDVFPFQGMKVDPGEKRAFVLTDGQPLPIISKKSEPFWSYDATFANRHYKEFVRAETFYDEHAYTGKTFFYRDFRPLGYDRIYYFDPEVSFQDKGMLGALRSYGFSIKQGDTLPDKYIPSKPDFTGVPIVDTIPPSNVAGVAASATKPNVVALEFPPATDNIGVVGYRIQRSESSTFPLNHTTVTLPDYTNVVIEDGKVKYSDAAVGAGTQYFYRVKAFDGQPNFSVAWSNVADATTPAIPDTTPPTVSLAAPPSTVSGTTALNATATDNVAIQKVDFYITNFDGTNTRYLGTQTTPNSGTDVYSFNWNTALDGIGNAITDGVYSLSAVAYDTSNLFTISNFRTNITVANNVNQIPTLSPIALMSGDEEISGDLTFADSDGTVEAVYVEASDTGANPNSAKGVGWETVIDGEAPDTGTTHHFVLTELGGVTLLEGQTVHFRAWVVDNDGDPSLRRFAFKATNPPIPTGGDFLTDDNGDFLMDDSGDFLTTD